MIFYTPMTKKAMKLCFHAHKDQLDKSGMPYVFHPFHLAEQMNTEDEIVTALLHDVVEDSSCTFEDLQAMGFSDAVLDALRLLTHDPAVAYMDYVAQIKGNPVAKAVKIADLNHNMNRGRVDRVEPGMLERWNKYEQALEFLLKEE